SRVRQRVLYLGFVAVVVAALTAWLTCRRHGGDDATRAEDRGATITPHLGPHAPAAPASLTGRVTRKSDGGALAGATVAVSLTGMGPLAKGHATPPAIVVTDASGAWTLPQLAPGTYVASATASGFLPGTHDRFVIAAGERRGGIDIALEPGGTVVRGTISDVGGGAIGGAQVYAVADKLERVMHGDFAPFVVASGGDGRYELTLPPGTFQLAIHHDDYMPAHKEIEVAA